MFGYKNGDIGVILELCPDPFELGLPSIKVFIFTSQKTVTIPTIYADKIGE